MEAYNPSESKFENPAALALASADVVLSSPTKKNTLKENQTLIELDCISEVLNFHRDYLVESTQAFIIPASFEESEPVEIGVFEKGITFSGKLETFAAVKIGYLEYVKINIRALCLTFNPYFLLPSFTTVKDNCLLFAPAYAINDIRPHD